MFYNIGPRIHPRSYSVSNRRPHRRVAMSASSTTPTVPETCVMMVPTPPVNSHVVNYPNNKPYYPYVHSGTRRRSYTMCSGVVSSWPRSW